MHLAPVQLALFPCRPDWVPMGSAVRIDHRTPDQLLRSTIAFCEWRAGESWRRLSDPSQRNDQDRWDWLEAARICQAARYASEGRLEPVLPSNNSSPTPSPLEVLFQNKPRRELADALISLNPELSDRRLLSRLPRPKLARMLARTIIAAGAGKAETMPPFRNTPTAGDQGGMTLAEIAQIEGVSQQRIRQIEQRALDKLRKKAPQSVTLLMVLAGELDRMRSERTPVLPDCDAEDVA